MIAVLTDSAVPLELPARNCSGGFVQQRHDSAAQVERQAGAGIGAGVYKNAGKRKAAGVVRCYMLGARADVVKPRKILPAAGTILLYGDRAEPAEILRSPSVDSTGLAAIREVSHLFQPKFQAKIANQFLAATAQVLGLTLVTADERLLGLSEIATLASRWLFSPFAGRRIEHRLSPGCWSSAVRPAG